MDDDGYELMPHDELTRLKGQIKKLKSGKQASSLQDSVEELNKNIEKLLDIFREALNEARSEGPELSEKLDRILDENEKIANAVLAIADMVQEAEQRPVEPRQPVFPPRLPPGPMPLMPPLSQEPFPRPPQQQMPDFEFNVPSPPPRPRQFGPMMPGELPPPPEPGMPLPPTGRLPPLPPRKKGLFRR